MRDVILRWLDRLSRRLTSRLTGEHAIGEPEVHAVRGFPVVIENRRPDIETARVLGRLGDALALVEQYQPWRYRHLQRDIRQFWIVRYPCRGAYFPAERTCMTELTFLARTDITAAQVAASIVHEGMHARMHVMGVRPESWDRPREERICRRAELDFGHALPPALGEPVIQRAHETLAASDDEVAPEIDWREAMRRQDLVDREARARSVLQAQEEGGPHHPPHASPGR